MSHENNGNEQKQLIDKISQDEWRKIEEKSKIDNVHIVSTIAAVVERYTKGKLENKPVRLPPLEENIINYLIDLSKEYNLVEEMAIIEEFPYYMYVERFGVKKLQICKRKYYTQ